MSSASHRARYRAQHAIRRAARDGGRSHTESRQRPSFSGGKPYRRATRDGARQRKRHVIRAITGNVRRAACAVSEAAPAWSYNSAHYSKPHAIKPLIGFVRWTQEAAGVCPCCPRRPPPYAGSTGAATDSDSDRCARVGEGQRRRGQTRPRTYMFFLFRVASAAVLWSGVHDV